MVRSVATVFLYVRASRHDTGRKLGGVVTHCMVRPLQVKDKSPRETLFGGFHLVAAIDVRGH